MSREEANLLNGAVMARDDQRCQQQNNNVARADGGEQVQLSVEELNFLDNGYSILASAGEGTVLASKMYEREGENETTTVSP